MRVIKLRIKVPVQVGNRVSDTFGDEHVVTEVTQGFYKGWIQVSPVGAPEQVTFVPQGNVAGVTAVYDGSVDVTLDDDTMQTPIERKRGARR